MPHVPGHPYSAPSRAQYAGERCAASDPEPPPHKADARGNDAAQGTHEAVTNRFASRIQWVRRMRDLSPRRPGPTSRTVVADA